MSVLSDLTEAIRDGSIDVIDLTAPLSSQTPVIRQVAGKSNPVEIGDGCWLGINVVILPGVRIGRQCVIGANAVVADDIPDFSVAAGVPARVLRSI